MYTHIYCSRTYGNYGKMGYFIYGGTLRSNNVVEIRLRRDITRARACNQIDKLVVVIVV